MACKGNYQASGKHLNENANYILVMWGNVLIGRYTLNYLGVKCCAVRKINKQKREG